MKRNWLVAFVPLMVATFLVAAAAGGATRARASPLVTCGQAVLHPRFPAAGDRLVLGVLSVPPASQNQVVRSGRRDWPYWRKAGLIVRDGSPAVAVSVAPAWRRRIAITWGGSDVVSSLKIAHCPGDGSGADGYAGGFYLRSPTACVPLIFRVGAR